MVRPVRSLHGEIYVAPDKSISHRALIFSALANGESHVKNILKGEDVKCTYGILKQMGVGFSSPIAELSQDAELVIQGVGLNGLKASPEIFYCGNSGTTMRLMLGLLAAQKFSSRLTGDSSLNKRPMERVMAPLAKMGGTFSVDQSDKGRIITVGSSAGLKGIDYLSPVASAQVKSSLLLAGLFADDVTRITEPSQSRDHSEIMLAAMGAKIKIDGLSVSIQSGELKPIDIHIPGDISSAAFFMVAALITPDSDIMIRHVGLNPTRTGLLDVLIAMGGDITIESQYQEGGEVVGDVRFRTSKLRNLEVSGNLVPRLIDEIPVLALAATQAEGIFTLRDASELRVKESDRIKTVTTELKNLGADITETADGFVIKGSTKLTAPERSLCGYGDHRLVMMAAIASGVVDSDLVLDDTECVQTSFPDFFDLLRQVSS